MQANRHRHPGIPPRAGEVRCFSWGTRDWSEFFGRLHWRRYYSFVERSVGEIKPSVSQTFDSIQSTSLKGQKPSARPRKKFRTVVSSKRRKSIDYTRNGWRRKTMGHEDEITEEQQSKGWRPANTAEREFGRPIIRNLGNNGGEVTFRTRAQAEDWAANEKRFILSITTSNTFTRPQSDNLRELRNAAIHYHQGVLDKSCDMEDHRARVEELLEKYQSHDRIHSQSQIGTMLLESSQIDAAYTLGKFLALSGIPSNRLGLEFKNEDRASFALGFAEACFRNDRERQSKVTEAVDAMKRYRVDMDPIALSVQKLRAECEQLETELIEVRGNEERELEALRNRYISGEQLKEPSKHWDRQEARHGGRLEAAIWVAGGVVMISAFAAWNLPKILDAGVKVFGDQAVSPLLPLSLVLIPAGIVFWLLNLISKTITHERTRRADAAFRRTATEVFLALAEDERNPVNQEHKALVLEAIFRAPPGDGGDRSAAGNPLDWIRSVRDDAGKI